MAAVVRPSLHRRRDTEPPPEPPHSRRPHRVLAVAAGLVAFSAWAGAIGLISGWMLLGTTVEHRLPYSSPVLGGLALATIIGVPYSVLSWLAAHGSTAVGVVAAVVGALMIGWIVVELAVIRQFSGLQPTMALIGVVFLVAGWRMERGGR